MAKVKKAKVVRVNGARVPKGRSVWPFADMKPPNTETGDLSVFYTAEEDHQAVRTAASRAMKSLGITLSVRKVKDPKDKHFGEIAVYRTA